MALGVFIYPYALLGMVSNLEDYAEKLLRILKDGHILCDTCSGRLFGLRGYGLSNTDRGRSLKTVLLMRSYKSGGERDEATVLVLAKTGFQPAMLLAEKLGLNAEPRTCTLCRGITGRYREYAEKAAEAASRYEFSTFQIGCRVPEEIRRAEEDLWRLYGLRDAESLKNEASREIGKIFGEITGKEYAPERPDMTLIIDLGSGEVEVEPSPLFICGRYRKLVRGLPQNPWPYDDVEGRIKYKTSIEELITRPAVEAAEGEDAKFHAAGREDIDARMLGRGRPFVVEIRKPRKRSIDLKLLEKTINERANGLIEVHGLTYCSGDTVKKLKMLAEIARKKYRLRVVFKKPLDEEKLKQLEEIFRDYVVSQRTPTRVLHRRADRVRRKVVYSVKAKKTGEREAEFEIECQGGFYVKEFIHGDEGRTKPSIAEILGNEVEEIELDVLDVEETR